MKRFGKWSKNDGGRAFQRYMAESACRAIFKDKSVSMLNLLITLL